MFPPWHQALQAGRVGVTVHVHQEWWRHEVGGLLSLLIQDIVVGVADQWTVIGVEEDFFRELQQTETYTLEMGCIILPISDRAQVYMYAICFALVCTCISAVVYCC